MKDPRTRGKRRESLALGSTGSAATLRESEGGQRRRPCSPNGMIACPCLGAPCALLSPPDSALWFRRPDDPTRALSRTSSLKSAKQRPVAMSLKPDDERDTVISPLAMHGIVPASKVLGNEADVGEMAQNLMSHAEHTTILKEGMMSISSKGVPTRELAHGISTS